MITYSHDYLLDKQIQIFQPLDGYRASSDAVLLSALPDLIKPGDTILDVGSGTGGISLCLAHRYNTNEITGLEIQPELAALAQQSADANGFSHLHYYHGDIKQKTLPVAPCSFNHVITNPPYSDHDMPSPNISKATAHNHHDINLSGWLHFCLKMLKPFGRLYLINRAEALNEILNALNGRAGAIKVIPIYSKPGQNAKRVMISAQKDSKTPTVIMPPLYIHQADGRYTDAANEILRQGKTVSEAMELL